MMVRCGACRTQFDVTGPGRYSCPSCGSVNMVRGAAAPPPSAAPGYAPGPEMPAGMPAAAPPPPVDNSPSPKIQCPECDFGFIVGDIAVASCPNCGAEVPTGRAPEDDA